MSIQRAPRPDSSFYVLDKAISEDKRLSWPARGMLIYLLGKPDNWIVSTAALVNETAAAIGKSSGRDGVRVILAELVQAGYLSRKKSRGEGGLLAGVDYVVHECPVHPGTEKPCPVKPSPDKPSPEKPGPVEPAPVNPPQTRTDKKQELSNNKEGDKQTLRTSFASNSGQAQSQSEGHGEIAVEMFTAADVVALGADPQHVAVWLLTRRRRKADNTRLALRALEREADKAGYSVAQAVQTCAERGWQGFLAEYVKPKALATGASGAAPKRRRRPSEMTTEELHAQMEADRRDVQRRWGGEVIEGDGLVSEVGGES